MKKIKLTEQELVKLINKMVNEAMSDMDKILDKIAASGYESISDKEKKYLDYYSKTGQFNDDVEDEFDKYTHPRFEGPSFSERIKDAPVSFTYETTEETENGIVHVGYFTIYEDEYYGEIFCDENGTFKYAHFESPEEVDLFEDYYKIQGELEMFFQNVCEELKADPTT
jgi:hypothetical protein